MFKAQDYNYCILLTSSIKSKPHSLFRMSSIIFSDSSDLFPPKATMLYVATTTPALPRNLSLLSDVKRQIWSSLTVDHSLNWKAHWSTDTAFVARQRQLFFIRHAADTPTRDFPAPHGKTMIPDLARPVKECDALSHHALCLDSIICIHSLILVFHPMFSRQPYHFQTFCSDFSLDKAVVVLVALVQYLNLHSPDSNLIIVC
jgi:hypothetical protein